MPKAIIIGSMKGGVGKTTFSILLTDMTRAAKLLQEAPSEVKDRSFFPTLMGYAERAAGTVVPIDVDVEPGKATGTSSLCRRCEDTIPFAVQPSDEMVVEDPSIVYRHFDMLSDLMCSKDVIIDLGANVLNRFLDWAEGGDAAKDWARAGVEIHFVTVTTADHSSFKVAADALERMKSICGEYAATLHGYVVMNRRDGGFERYADSVEWERLAACGSWATSIHINKCIATEIWPYLDVSEYMPAEVLRMTEEELTKAFSLKPMQARRGWKQYVSWYLEVLTEVLDVGLLGSVGGIDIGAEKVQREYERETDGEPEMV